MATTLRLVALDGTELLNIRPAVATAGDSVWCTQFDLGGAAPRESTQDLAGQSGTIDQTTYHGPRTVTCELKLGNATRYSTLDTLRALSNPSNRFYIYVKADSWSSERRMLLRPSPIGCVVDPASANMFTVSTSWICPSGSMESVNSSVSSLRPVPSASQGLAFPAANAVTPGTSGGVGLAFPAGNAGSGIGLAFLSGNSLNQGVVTNEGSEKASPIIFIRNQASNPQIVNQTNGQSITVKNMSITDGHYLVIDVANRTILMDGDPNNSRYGYIDWTSSNWLVLEPGNNTIQYNASSPGSNSTVDILWRGRWI